MRSSIDPYQVLGVSRDASPDDIKRAYYSAAHKHHPDKQNGSTAAMVQINQAYDCLGDTERRRIYDETGQVDKARGIEDEIRALLLQAFMDALQQEASNSLTHATTQVKKSLSKLQAQRGAIESAKAKLLAKQGKVKTKEPSVENVFQMLLDQKLVEVEQALLTTMKGIEVHELVLKQLKHYSSSEPEQQQIKYVVYSTSSNTVGSNTTGW